MAFRAVYIIKLTSTFPDSVLFQRKFPIIEKKCRETKGENYVGIPINFPVLICDELELFENSETFNIKHNSCLSRRTAPVYRMLDGKLEPIVAFYRNGLVYCCIAYDEEENTEEVSLLSPAVALAYAMLENMCRFVGFGCSFEVLQQKFQSLHKYVSTGFPFGIPSELDITTALGIASYTEGAPVPKIKGPSWRPASYKGKQSLNLEIKEYVKALQFDNNEIGDICEVFGSIHCKVEVEDSPEISLDITAPLESTVHNQMLYHPCVETVDDVTPIMKSDNTRQFGSRKLRFCPPMNDFELCHYKVKIVENEMPVKAFFQMKGDQSKITLMVQLHLAEQMKNTFESFDVRIPFFNRGPIVDFKCLTSSNVVLLPDKCTLQWNVCPKFSTKGADKILEANVTFDESVNPIRIDPLLAGVNSYVLMSWKINDFTYSGLKFETKSVGLLPSNKIKVNSATSFQTVEYKVWNSRGNVTNTCFTDVTSA